MPAKRQISLDPSLQHGKAKLLQPRSLVLSPGLETEIGERTASPERKAFAKPLGSLGRSGVGPSHGQLLEALPIQGVLVREHERVAGGSRHYPVA